MKICNVDGYKLNRKYVSTINDTNNTKRQVNLYQQKPDVFFCASAPDIAELRKIVEQIPRQDDNAIFNNIIDYATNNVENIYQVNFLKKILEAKLNENHPIIKDMQLNMVSEFQDVFKSIKTEENLDAKSYMFDFLLKRPNFMKRDEGYHKSQLLEFSNNNCHKDFIQYFDDNYALLMTNDEFPKDFRFLMGLTNTPEQTALYKNFIDFVKSHYHGKNFKTMPLGEYLHAINNEHNSNYVKSMLPITNEKDRYYFLDWYLINGIKSEEASKTMQNVFKTIKQKQMSLKMEPEKFIYAVNSDKNLDVEGLLEIDKKYGISRCNPYCAPEGYDKYFWDKYVAIHSKAKTNDLNQYSRALLNYIIEKNVYKYDCEKYDDFLSERVLKSINNPERLKEAIAIVNEYMKDSGLAKSTPYGYFDLMFSRYNMNAEEIISLKRKYFSCPYDDDLYYQMKREFRNLETKYQESHKQ